MKEATEDVILDFLTKIENAATNWVVENEIAPEVADTVMCLIDRERIANAIQARVKTLTGVRQSIAVVRRMVACTHSSGSKAVTPEWCKAWAYVCGSTKGFINLDTMDTYKTPAFNALNGKHVPEQANGRTPKAARFCSSNGFVPVVRDLIYNPTLDSGIIDDGNGGTLVNTYMSDAVPKAATEYTDSGKETVARIEAYIARMCGSDGHADVLVQWLAHQVQSTGYQVRWSPLIQSTDSRDKELLTTVLQVSLGRKNVKAVTAKQVTSGFNEWAEGAAVNVIQEIDTPRFAYGHAFQFLKTVITHDDVAVNRRYINGYTAKNATNYITFTNRLGELPIGSDDRRYWLARVDDADADQNKGYDDLVHAIDVHGSEVRKWLSEYPVSDQLCNAKPTADRFEQL